MATLTGQTPAATYKDLLKIAASSYNAGLDGTLRTIEDGDATASALQLSTAGIKSTGSLEVSGNATFDSKLTASNYRAQFKGNTTTGFAGASVEIGHTGTTGFAISYNRDTSAYTDLELYGSNIYNRAKGSAAVWDVADVEQMRLTSTGLGIGGISPTYQLHLSTDSAGKPTTNTWTVTSDARIKKDIVDADLQRCLEIVKSIPLKHYGYKDGVYLDKSINDKSQLGWIAQEVEAVFPKAVTQNKFEYQEKIESTTEVEEYEEKDEVSGEMIKKTRPKLVPIETIDDCRSLNADQIYKAMFGALQLLIQKVEALENK